jgi:hypothetical protein
VRKSGPQALKRAVFYELGGTSELVPFPVLMSGLPSLKELAFFG